METMSEYVLTDNQSILEVAIMVRYVIKINIFLIWNVVNKIAYVIVQKTVLVNFFWAMLYKFIVKTYICFLVYMLLY